MNSRRKGASFENLLAKDIRRTFKVDNQDCYRTPLSGGHHGFGLEWPGDIYISERLFPLFPFVVEAKHRRNWHAVSFQRPTKEQAAWLRHLLRQDLPRSPRDGAMPLMVCRGQNTPIYAALRLPDFKALGMRLPQAYIGWAFQHGRWLQVRWPEFLEGLAAANAEAGRYLEG